MAYLTKNTLKLNHKTWLTEHIITLTVWSLNGWETSGSQSFMIRKQALESFCLVYFLATLLICTGCTVMAVYYEVGKMWLDITVTFTILSQQLFAGPVENHEKYLTSQFLVWELKSGSRRNTTNISQKGNDNRVAAPHGSCLRVAPTKSWPATPTLGGSVSCCTRLSSSTLYQLKLKRRTSVWLYVYCN